MAGYRPPYTVEEQRSILNIIIKNKKFFELRGNSCWKELAESDKTNRTWQSLKEHFRKALYPQIHYPSYGLTAKQINWIRTGFQQTAAGGSKVKEKPSATSSSVQKKDFDLKDIVDSSEED